MWNNCITHFKRSNTVPFNYAMQYHLMKNIDVPYYCNSICDVIHFFCKILGNWYTCNLYFITSFCYCLVERFVMTDLRREEVLVVLRSSFLIFERNYFLGTKSPCVVKILYNGKSIEFKIFSKWFLQFNFQRCFKMKVCVRKPQFIVYWTLNVLK